jgi:hypothetical protein
MTATGLPTADTLTDRYVWAVLRSIPEKQRADIDAELRATIADAVDARREAGGSEADAERGALVDLGDPAILAAGYADRPLHLIGPALFLDYSRLLRLLLAIVLPCVVLGVGIANAIQGHSFGEVVGGAVVTALTVGVHLCFWITLIFAILERTRTTLSPFVPWSPDGLSAVPSGPRTGFGEAITTVVFLLLFAGGIAWQQFFSVFDDAERTPIPFLEPGLWSFWLPYALVITGLQIVLAVVLFGVGRWTWPLATAHAVLAFALAIPALWLLVTGRLLNEAFFAEFGWAEIIQPGGVVVLVGALVVAGIAIGTAVDGFVKARRGRR